MKQILFGVLPLALLLGGVGQAKADLALSGMTGSVYEGYYNTTSGISPPSTVGTIAGNPGITSNPYATFSLSNSSSLNFLASGPTGATNYTIGAFLSPNSPSFTGHNGFSSTDTLGGTYFIISGTATITTPGNYALTFAHDDGAELLVTQGGSTVLDFQEGGSTTASQSNPRGPYFMSGTYQFTVSYYSNAAPPSQLTISAILATPEPATMTMAAIGLVAFGGYKLRRRKPVVA